MMKAAVMSMFPMVLLGRSTAHFSVKVSASEHGDIRRLRGKLFYAIFALS